MINYKNPIIKGFHPDPSVCRVGKDYYLVTSTFEYFPGIPVYHSTDLINWELIGHCIDRAEQLPMEMAKASGGIWAPTIRYDSGTFYVTATFSEKGNFIVHSQFPAKGYSNAVWTEMDGIDPSMFFENGEMYYCANDWGSRSKDVEGISVAAMDPLTGKVKGEIKRIWNGTKNGWLEAPHIYHIGEYYYLFAAEGGSGWGHMVTTARSKSIWGEYEPCPRNPILTNRNDTSKQVLETGHGDLTEDEEGNYYLVHLGIRPCAGSKTNLGRETFLTPLRKEDNWFYTKDGKARINEKICRTDERACCKTIEQRSARRVTADFGKTDWEKEWLFVGAPDMANYSRGEGALVLRPSKESFQKNQTGVTFAAMRQPDFVCEVQTSLECDGTEIASGLAAYLAPGYFYRIYLSCEKEGRYVVVEKSAEDFHQTAYREKVSCKEITFTLRADKDKYRFSYNINGREIPAAECSTRFLCTAMPNRCFTGTVIGVFAEGNEEETVRIQSFAMQ